MAYSVELLPEAAGLATVGMQWEVVGGGERANKPGILVRQGKALGSLELPERLSKGSIVEELELVGDRLHYRLMEGPGPGEGWVSLSFKGKSLVIPLKQKLDKEGEEEQDEQEQEEEEDVGGPGQDSGPVEINTELRTRMLEAAKAKEKDGALFLYLPKYKALGFPLAKPRIRILCFHNEGSAETNYTQQGTPFVNWAVETQSVEICAFDYPGRAKLLKETRHSSIETLAPDLLAAVHEKLSDGVPYMVWAHGVGTWVAFEFLMLCRKVGVQMPKAGFFMAFPAPHMPPKRRLWRRSARLKDEKFKEELINWDKAHFTGAGKCIFEVPSWKDSFMPLFRADFRLFDEYRCVHSGAPKFDFPIHSWHFAEEHYVQKDMVELWGDWTSDNFETRVLPGMGHLSSSSGGRRLGLALTCR